jgi:hypothetical protein
MFDGYADAQQRADKIVAKLTDLSTNKGHDKHLHAKECQDLGLEVRFLEDKQHKKLHDLVLTVHHCYMYSLSNTSAFKFIENHTGRRWIKAQVQQQIILQQPVPIIAPPVAPSTTPQSPP